MRIRPTLATLFLLTACKEEPMLHGQVVDVWGHPIQGATVVLEGQATRPATDAAGSFAFPMHPGTYKLKAGHEGYIQEHLQLEIPPEGDATPRPVLRLYPKPGEAGFYVVGRGKYEKLAPERVYSVGNELGTVTGLKSIEARVSSDDFRTVFHTDLRMDEIVRLGLELHAMEYHKEVELPGPLGSSDVQVNLWTSKKQVPIELAPMRSKSDYLVTVEGDLEPGWYAFHTQNLLDPDEPTDLQSIPEALRVAFPFELR